MPETFKYDLLKGEVVVGRIVLNFKLSGSIVSFTEYSVLKAKYRKLKTIKIPIKQKVLWDKGGEVLLKVYLDVTRKSNRQIVLLLDQFGVII